MNTTHDSTPAVEHGTLTLGRQLGQGGQGTVHEVTNKKINKSAGGGGWDVVYKEYSPTVLPGLDTAALGKMVALPGELIPADSRWLCEKAAWPASMVERQGHTSGFLMRAVPDRFQFELRSLSSNGSGTKLLANLEFLLNEDSYVASIGLTVSDRDRLLLLADLATTLNRLRRLNISVGDLSPKNLLFAVDKHPEVFLIDCDAVRLRGITVLPQAETPDWHVPVGEEKATPAGDVYKLGLLAVRLIARHQTTTDPSALAAISPELGDLARTSLNPDPARRPTPSVWAEQLSATSRTASTAPASTTAAPNRSRPNHTSSTGRPATGGPPGTAPTPAPSPGSINWSSLKETVFSVAAGLLFILILVGVSQNDSDSDSEGNASPQSTVSEETYAPPEPSYEPSDGGTSTSGDDDSGDDSYETSAPEEPDPLDEAFAEVSPGDCLNVYDDGYGDWSEDEPGTVPCDWTTAYVSVTDVTDDSDACEEGGGRSAWSHVNDDATTTALCLERQFQEATCFLAAGSGGKPDSANLMTVWDCDASKVPVEYDFIMQITAVGAGTEGDCGQDYSWEVLGGEGTICAMVA
ncbi:hypothetical protein OG778_10180 [Streptomyces sp. NBC_00184]|uniref:hypothetical protein n=1 Tax=Streptomyces sp. NBC_00184 TaxID=2975673 RepID=UPI002E2CEB12|nr:hypothetical protein [Streptomyces sp. NBC_00184]